MLIQSQKPRDTIRKLAGDPVRGFTLRYFYNNHQGETPSVLVDDLVDPKVVVLCAGANVMVYGAIQNYIPVMKDLLKGRVEQEQGWPSPSMKKEWKEWMDGRKGMFLNTTPYAVYRAAILAGFEPHPRDPGNQVAYMWYWQGAPRLQQHVEHACRATEGVELFDLMRQSVSYDPDGHYIRMCLERGPSFVCEVDGEPVCWSCTHLNGTMGMIYTPDENRRKGYAKSLAAFQIDFMLKRDGIACCHVIDYNTASMNLVSSMGGTRWEEAVIWRTVYWPGHAPELEEIEKDAVD